MKVDSGEELMDVETVVTGWANGDENVCTTVDDIDAALEDCDNKKVKKFLKAVLKEVSGKAGDVVFHK